MSWPQGLIAVWRQDAMVGHMSTATIINAEHPLRMCQFVSGDREWNIDFDLVSRMLIGNDVHLIRATHAPSRVLTVKVKGITGLARFCSGNPPIFREGYQTNSE